MLAVGKNHRSRNLNTLILIAVRRISLINMVELHLCNLCYIFIIHEKVTYNGLYSPIINQKLAVIAKGRTDNRTPAHTSPCSIYWLISEHGFQ